MASPQNSEAMRMHLLVQRLSLSYDDLEELKSKDGDLMSRLQRQPQRKANFDAELAKHRLNESQLRAVHRTFSSSIGAHLVWGPLGSGRTEYLMAAVCAAAAAGLRVLVTAHSRDCVAFLAARFADVAPIAATEWAYYNGSGVMALPLLNGAAEDPDSDVYQSNRAAQFSLTYSDVSFSSGPITKYSKRKVDWIKELADACCNDLSGDEKNAHQKAAEYVQILQRLRSSSENESAVTEEDDSARFTALNQYFDARFLHKRAKVIFAINHTSGDDVLKAYFRPDIHFLDDATLSQPPDNLIPWVAFRHTLSQLVLVGDFAQGKAKVWSWGSNPFAHALATSIFEARCKDPRMANHRSVLSVQCRMTPYLSAFPREHLYNEIGLADAEEVKGKTEVQKQLDVLFKDLKEQQIWNGKPRMVIDCFGTSEINEYGRTFNEEEAQISALLVRYMTTTGNIDPSKITVLTPYEAQMDLIRQKLSESVDPRPAEVKVKTTCQMQMDDNHIVILSFARPIEAQPNDLGSIYGPKYLAREITRARDFLVVLGGNLKALGQDTEGEDEYEYDDEEEEENDTFLQSDCKLFRKFIADCLNNGDVMSAKDFRLAMEGGKVVEPDF